MSETEKEESYLEPDTPKKIIYFLPESCHTTCLICFKTEVQKHRTRLFDDDGSKREICSQLEDFSGQTIKFNSSYRILCRNCNRMINNDVKRKEKRKIQLQNSVKKSKLELKFKTKRMSKGELSSRKKIDYGIKDGSMEEKYTSLFENVKVSCVYSRHQNNNFLES